MEIRALRNLTDHEYTETDLSIYFKQLKSYSTHLIAIRNKLNESNATFND